MFVQIMQGTVSDAAGFRRQGERWAAELRPGAGGFLGSTAGLTADGTGIVIARFESEAAARANSDRPEQGAWWGETERCFAGPVTFAESTDVETLLGGGSDGAGFVQVMRGSVPHRTSLAEMDALFTELAPTWRPDVIGGIRAWLGESDYVEAIYFTSEAEARASESKEPPPELAARMAEYGELMAGVTYYDLVDPILTS